MTLPRRSRPAVNVASEQVPRRWQSLIQGLWPGGGGGAGRPALTSTVRFPQSVSAGHKSPVLPLSARPAWTGTRVWSRSPPQIQEKPSRERAGVSVSLRLTRIPTPGPGPHTDPAVHVQMPLGVTARAALGCGGGEPGVSRPLVRARTPHPQSLCGSRRSHRGCRNHSRAPGALGPHAWKDLFQRPACPVSWQSVGTVLSPCFDTSHLFVGGPRPPFWRPSPPASEGWDPPKATSTRQVLSRRPARPARSLPRRPAPLCWAGRATCPGPQGPGGTSGSRRAATQIHHRGLLTWPLATGHWPQQSPSHICTKGAGAPDTGRYLTEAGCSPSGGVSRAVA